MGQNPCCGKIPVSVGQLADIIFGGGGGIVGGGTENAGLWGRQNAFGGPTLTKARS